MPSLSNATVAAQRNDAYWDFADYIHANRESVNAEKSLESVRRSGSPRDGRGRKVRPGQCQTADGLFETKQYAEAEPLLTQVSQSPELESKRKAILLTLADTKVSLGSLSGADGVLQELNQLDPKFPALHRTLGIVFQREGRLTEAQVEYHREFQVSGDMQAEQQAIALKQALSQPR